MNVSQTLIVAWALLATACSDSSDVPYVEQLVDRFDVPACDGVSFVKAGKEASVENGPVSRVYSADGPCIENLKDAFAIIGFEEIEPSVYKYQSEQGYHDVVKLERSDAHKEMVIKWETYEQ